MISGAGLSRLEKAVEQAEKGRRSDVVTVRSDDVWSLIRSYRRLMEKDEEADRLRSALRLIKEVADG